MTTRCEEMTPLVGPLVDGELAPADAALVQAHVESCARCESLRARLAAQAALLREAVAAKGAAASMDGFADGVMARIARAEKQRKSWDALRLRGSSAMRTRRFGLGASAGLALAACLALVLLFRPGEPGLSAGRAQLALSQASQALALQASHTSIDELEYDDGSNGAILQLHARNAPNGLLTTVIWLSDDPAGGSAR